MKSLLWIQGNLKSGRRHVLLSQSRMAWAPIPEEIGAFGLIWTSVQEQLLVLEKVV